ncbi:MAG: hypothetical protein AAFX09_11975 [Pseudomonadota bacterium]
MLERCSSIESNEARLACFDLVMRGGDAGVEFPDTSASAAGRETTSPSAQAGAGVSEFGEAESGGGFPLALPGFGRPESESRDDLASARTPDSAVLETGEDGRLERVRMTIREVRTVGYNTIRFHMANGQVWEVTDSDRVWIPRGDDPLQAEIRRGSFGGYLLRINGEGRAIRVDRLD